jgi:hypothetical protein
LVILEKMQRHVFNLIDQEILFLPHPLLLSLNSQPQLADPQLILLDLGFLIINKVYFVTEEGGVEHAKAHLAKRFDLANRIVTPLFE